MFSTSCVPSDTGGLEPEGRDAVRKRQIIVDGLRHVANRDCAIRFLFDAGCGEGRVVPADGHEVLDVEGGQRLDDVGHLLGVLRRIVARGADHGAAPKMDAGNLAVV